MGLKYLDGKNWSDITREERYYCMKLYMNVMQTGIDRFVDVINRLTGAELDPSENWELGYEVCFFRDVRYFLSGKIPLESPKRTFDLCLLSDKSIVIIEAKCAERFKLDQLADFDEDRNRINRLTKSCPEFQDVKVVILGLVANAYLVELAGQDNKMADSIYRSFEPNTRFMTWEALAEEYENPDLMQAGAIFNSSAVSFDKWNTGGYYTGPDLVEALMSGKDFWVGRKGAFDTFKLDVQNGSWKKKKYQTNTQHSAPSSNWFMLSEIKSIVSQLTK